MSVTILCVHDDPALARQHAEVLESEGHGVLAASNGRRSLEILRRQQPDFVVLDAYLPRQDGFEILAEMRAMPAHRDTPVLLVCEGDVTDDLAARARALGAVGVEPLPVAPARLLAWVKKALEKSRSGTGDAAARATIVPRTGTLRELPVPELFNGLRVDRHTGVLMLAHGKKKKAVELRDGWPISVKSNLLSECLGAYLVQEGRCSQAEHDESVARMRAGEGLQGQILVAMDVLDEESVVEVLQDHAREKLFELYGWRDGRFEVRAGAHVQRGSTLGLEGHPAQLIVEGVRRSYPIKQIDRFLEACRGQYLVPRSDGEAQVSEVGLNERESEWVASLDGGNAVEDLLSAPDWMRRLAFGLVSIEFLGVESAAGDRGDARRLVDRVAHAETHSPQDEALRVELAELANRIRDKDPYQVLEVSRDADDEEIRVAYACLAKRTHPDRFHAASSSVRQLASQVFDRITQAHAMVATADDRRMHASQQRQSQRLEAVEDEGRRALMAETEYQRGEAKLAERDYEGALLCFGRAMEHFPSEGEYRSAYGWCLYLCHPDNDVMLGEALEHCREGLKLAKDREKPYLLLGRLYKAMGKIGAATKMFSRAVEIKPQCVEAMRELRILNMRRDKDKGVLKRIFRR